MNKIQLQLSERDTEEVFTHGVSDFCSRMVFCDFGAECIKTYDSGFPKEEGQAILPSCIFGQLSERDAKIMFLLWVNGVRAVYPDAFFVVRRCPTIVYDSVTGAYYLTWRAAVFQSEEMYLDSELCESIRIRAETKTPEDRTQ